MGIADARIVAMTQEKRLKEVLQRKAASDRYSGLMEHVAQELATRLQNYTTGLSPEMVAAYDQPENRHHYVDVQRVLANLRLRERAALGYFFDSTAQKLKNAEQGFAFQASYLDSQPEWVYVLGASKKVERAEVLSLLTPLLCAAMAQYRKTRSLIVIDRDGVGYEEGQNI